MFQARRNIRRAFLLLPSKDIFRLFPAGSDLVEVRYFIGDYSKQHHHEHCSGWVKSNRDTDREDKLCKNFGVETGAGVVSSF